MVCHCHAVNDRAIRAAVASGALDADDVAALCGATSRCGGCREVVEQVVDEARATLIGLPDRRFGALAPA